MIIPVSVTACDILNYLEEIMNNFNSLNFDSFVTGAIQAQLGAKEQIMYTRFITHNPTRTIFGFWSEESIINNATFIAVSNKDVILLKENWSKWFFFKDMEKIMQLMDPESAYNCEDQAMISMAQKMAD
mmetsp:Transcript_7293/g.5587  ORF Transcript_7293/g.5587 Transcript_7293/m.5587 type:complete len:129 (+) Transcript_7293:3026-3412(+)